MRAKRLHKQIRSNTCAVASLRTVLDLQFGVKIPEHALEAHATTAAEPIVKHGTSASQLRLMVKGASRTHNLGTPWTIRFSCHGTLKHLKKELVAGRYPLARMYEPNESADYHMIVVLQVEDGRVQVWDPDPKAASRPAWMDELAFELWWGGDGEHSWYAVVGGGDGKGVDARTAVAVAA